METKDNRDANQLENERQNILLELDELGLQGLVSSALQARYNQIIDDQLKPLLPDPLTILPPELCTQIFREAIGDGYDSSHQVEDLLLLSSVSTSWCHYLVSVSSFWGNILLSCEREDNLAMVVTCLALSKEYSITLFVDYIQPGLEMYKAVLTPHAGRITKIDWWTSHHGDIFPFIKSLGHLPVLKDITFSYSLMEFPDIEKHFSQLMRNAPSLVSFFGLVLNAEMLHHPCVANFTLINTRTSFSEFLRISGENQGDLLPQLQVSFLNFLSPFTDFNHKGFPNLLLNLTRLGLLDPSPGYGELFKHCFQGIKTLMITISSEDTLGELLVALSFCPRVTQLYLTILEMVQSIPERLEYSKLKSLGLLSMDKDYGPRTFDLDRILERIPTIMPCLQDVTFYGRILLKDKGLHYFGQLKDLRKLSIWRICSSIQLNDPVCFENLEQMDLGTSILYDRSLMLFKNLRSLAGCTMIHDRNILDYPHPASYAVPPSSFNTLVRLAVSISLPVRLQLGLLPLLESMTLSNNLTGTWAGDILEQIIFTPKICPKLHTITTEGLLAEWDILLLMLLRRNFLHERTIAKIRGIGVRYWLPPTLLQPISQLLRGRFVPDLDLEAFSLERIAKILYRTPSE
ncbi:hypothetical protein FRC19_005071 [Serendipita sp. 401]|nr:hypothetical protein FRC19_005071 [Serendipita sp. 401]